MFDTTLHRLRVFKVVIEAGGISSAAVELGSASQPYLRTSTALEALVGQPLLTRRAGQHTELTDAGRVLYSYAHDAILGADSVMTVLDDINQGMRGRMGIAVTRTLGHSVIAPVLAKYHEKVPRTVVTVRTGQLSEVIQFVTSGAASFALVVSSAPIGSLETEFLRNEPVYLVASPMHRLAGRESIMASELLHEEFIIGIRDGWNFRGGLAYLQHAGLSYERIVVETDDYVTVKRLVELNCGIAMLPRESVEGELEAGRLVALQTDFELPTFQLSIARLRTHRFTPSESRLIALIRETLANDGELHAV